MTALRRQWRRFRGLPAAAQAGVVVAFAAAYTVAIVALVGGDGDGDGEVRTVVQSGSRPAALSPIERRVSRAVQRAPLFQRESGDVAEFRRARVTSVRCKESCRVVYTVAVPGRGRILFQQLEMVRRILRDTDVERVVLRVVRVAPTGPAASPKGEEETVPGFPLMETTCYRSRLGDATKLKTQKSAQEALNRACTVREFDQGVLHGGGRGAEKPEPGGRGN